MILNILAIVLSLSIFTAAGVMIYKGRKTEKEQKKEKNQSEH